MAMIVCSRWNCRRPPRRPFAKCTEHLIEDLEAQIAALSVQIKDPDGSPTLWFRNALISRRKLLKTQLGQLRESIEAEPTLAPTTEDPAPTTPVVAPAPSQPPRTEHTMALVVIGALLLAAGLVVLARSLLRRRPRHNLLPVYRILADCEPRWTTYEQIRTQLNWLSDNQFRGALATAIDNVWLTPTTQADGETMILVVTDRGLRVLDSPAAQLALTLQ
ncbi:MAG TPA: hypothetical protein VMT30_01990 [Candidatus Saccharimonadia bacterium]|nr:hypothetical protein [Candidatus Saccharimonadia bacterium]